MTTTQRVMITGATLVFLGAGCGKVTPSAGSNVSATPIVVPDAPTPPPAASSPTRMQAGTPPAPPLEDGERQTPPTPPPAGRVEVRTVTGTAGPVTITAEETVTTSCADDACFQKAFAACATGATLTSDVGFASYHYRIVGARSDGCAMETYYPTNPNPAWVNKKMTCTYNNRGNFEDAAQAMLNNLSTCTGPLAEILKSL